MTRRDNIHRGAFFCFVCMQLLYNIFRKSSRLSLSPLLSLCLFHVSFHLRRDIFVFYVFTHLTQLRLASIILYLSASEYNRTRFELISRCSVKWFVINLRSSSCLSPYFTLIKCEDEINIGVDFCWYLQLGRCVIWSCCKTNLWSVRSLSSTRRILFAGSAGRTQT